jgi:hypothetical protein
MAKNKSATTKKLNLMLSNGLYAISAKVRPGVSLVPVFLTDFAVSVRLVLDTENGKVLPNRYGVELAGQDVEMIVGVLGLEKKSEDEKKIAEAGKMVADAKEMVKEMVKGAVSVGNANAFIDIPVVAGVLVNHQRLKSLACS